MATTDPRILECFRDHDRMSSERSVYEGQWDDAARRLTPGLSFYNASPRPTSSPETYDGTPAAAAERFAAALNGLLTPPGQKWHALKVQAGRQNPAIDPYLEAKRDALFSMRYAGRSDFVHGMMECYRSLAYFGNGAVMVDDHLGKKIRYETIPLRSLWWSIGADGTPDRVHRQLDLTGHVALQFFSRRDPGDRLPEALRTRIEADRNKTYTFLHFVRPNDERDEYRADAKGMKFSSYYVTREDKLIVAEGGFRTMPYCIARYITDAGEAYGKGPTQKVFPSIRMANTMKRSALIYGNRIAEPSYITRDHDVSLKLEPNAMNFGMVGEDGRPLVLPLQMAGGDYAMPVELMQAEDEIIRDAYLDTLWQILVEKPTATATEVLERSAEKGILLSPCLGLQPAFLGAMIDRELDIMSAAGLFADAPDALLQRGGVVEVDYDSPLNQAQSAGEGASVLRLLEGAAPAIAVDPRARMRINGDEAIKVLARAWRVPASVLRSDDEVDGMEQQSLEQQQLQSIVAAAPAAAGAAKDLAQAQGAMQQAGAA